MRRGPQAVAWLIVGVAVAAHAAPCPPDLCGTTANSCRVEQSCELERAATIDLSGRDLVIAAGVTVTVVESPLVLAATSLALEGGAVLIAPDHKARGGGTITITTAGGIHVGSDARIDVAGEFIGGKMTLEAGSDVVVDGVLDAGVARFGESGAISVTTSGGSIALGASSRVLARSAGPGGGGPVTLFAPHGRITIDGTIDVQGGFIGGDVDASAGGDISVSAGARLSLDGTNAGSVPGVPDFFVATGGNLELESGDGDVILEAAVTATGTGAGGRGGQGGEGGSVALDAPHGNVLLAGPIDVSGYRPGEGGFGGDVSAFAGGRITQRAPITAAAHGDGGRVDFFAGDMLTLGNIDVSADEFGGLVDAMSSTAIVLARATRINADSPAVGGDVTLSAPALTVEGTITSRAPYRIDGSGGFVTLGGCDVGLPTRAHISVSGRGGGGGVEIHAAGSLSLGARVRAGGEGGLILVAHGFLPPPVITRFRPAPILVHDVTNSLCAPSPATSSTTTTTATTLTSSTTTTATSTTSTTGTNTITTTTATAVIANTTTTAVPAEKTSAPLPECTPEAVSACDDGNPCTADRCTAGGCVHDPVSDFEQVLCRLETVRELLADGTTRHVRRPPARFERRIVRVSTLVRAAENAGGRRVSALLGSARRALRGFLQAVERSRTLDLARRQQIMRTAGDALQRLPALARRAISARRAS